MFNKKQKEIDRLKKTCEGMASENKLDWERRVKADRQLSEAWGKLDTANSDLAKANEQIESDKKELAKWKEWADAIEKYYSTATITEHHELKKVTKKGKIKWLPYTDNGDGTIEIYGEIYDKAAFGKFEDRIVREITYSEDMPCKPGGLDIYHAMCISLDKLAESS